MRRANARLADYQRVRGFSIWPYDEFPRTEGTGKLKRLEIARGAPPRPAPGPILNVPLENLTSLERVERMVALGLDEADVSSHQRRRRRLSPRCGFSDLESRRTGARRPPHFPARISAAAQSDLRARRTRTAWRISRISQPPVIFASNHQSYMDVPAIMSALPARWRYRVAPAMRKEFFEEHFHGHSFTNSLNYYFSSLFFNAFPIPQREPGALATLRYIGELANDKWCLLIFPEGNMTGPARSRPSSPASG